MSRVRYSTESQRCLIGVEGCDCDNPFTIQTEAGPVRITPTACECHDCYVCGEICCPGHKP